VECAHVRLEQEMRAVAAGRLVRIVYSCTKRNVKRNLNLLETEFPARYYPAGCCIINGSAPPSGKEAFDSKPDPCNNSHGELPLDGRTGIKAISLPTQQTVFLSGRLK
jgi:hypothetical protein